MQSPGPPLHASSPNRETDRTKEAAKYKARTLKIINVNCQSIKANKETFTYMVQQQNPDIIIGTESWLTDEDTNNSCLPTETYNIEIAGQTNRPPWWRVHSIKTLQ